MTKIFKHTLFSILILNSNLNVFAQKSDFTLEDIFTKGTFRVNFAPTINFMADGISYSQLDQSDSNWLINKYAIESVSKNTKPRTTLLNSANLNLKIKPENYQFTADEKNILLFEQTEAIYRRSYKSIVYIANLATKKSIKVREEKIMYPTLSPNNTHLAYVFENNVYILNLITNVTYAVTTNGKKNSIINGAVDWVYEEEFGLSSGIAWNVTGNALAFYQMDESAVKEFSMDIFSGLYPSQEKWKYPKAGEANSIVGISIHDITSQKNTELNLNSNADQYIPRFKWTKNPEVLSVQRLNRLQNFWELLLCSVKNPNPKVVLTEKDSAYIEISDNLTFLNENQFIYTSEKNGYNHIYIQDIKLNTNVQITNGKWDVLEILSVDLKKNVLYYTSSEISSNEDHLFKIDLVGKNKKQITTTPGNHSIQIAPGNTYYIDNTSTFSQMPTVQLKSFTTKTNITLAQNNATNTKMSSYNFGKCEIGKWKINGNILNYWMIKPYNFDSTKKYPVLMHVYGGPGHNTVSNSYGYTNYLWHQYLSQKGYIIVSVDNRGTLKQGAKFKKSTYKQLGNLEHLDQSAVALYLGNLTFIDKSRIGVWGWSFGGYLSSLCITKSADIFKTAIAVAPVTNWRYYDNIYTERFLQTPKLNPSGYDNNSPINFVKNIKGNYLIIHGSADDNVHLQNSMEMIQAMIQKNIKFDSEIYPNKNHSITGGNTKYHLYQRLTNYVQTNL